ncbi:MAG TPA: hypothetical protein VF070_44045 [Streptosporangiaceae bacterium]
MMGRDRRNGRANLKTRVGIAAAVLVGGSAIGVAAVAASSHGSSSAASAGYSTRSSWGFTNPGTQLVNAMNNWRSFNPYSSYGMLSGFSNQWMQTTHHGKVFAVQRGIVVLATRKFIILQSAQNGHLSLWLTSGNTNILNVSNTAMGTGALIGNTSATTQAMVSNNMVPATNILAGSTQVAQQMVAPTPATQTVKVVVAGTNLTVTVSITQTTATVQQTALTSWGTRPAWHPMTWTQNPWTTAANWTGLMRGDLALIAGFRAHGLLHAQIVLFTPLNTGMLGGTGTGTPSPVPSSTTGVSGTHS